MILKLCPRCKRPTEHTNQLCPSCQTQQPAHTRQRNADYDRLRDPILVRFYNSLAWRQLRRWYLQKIGGLCEECMTEWRAGRRAEEDIQIATEVHHKQPVRKAWNRRLDSTNLKGECKAHHNAERKGS